MIRKYFQAILDNSPESIVLIGKNHEVLAFNKTIQTLLFQYHKKEIKEGDFYYPDFVVEPNRQLYLDAFQSALNGVPFLVQNLTKNESVSLWFEYNMQPVYNEGELIGVTLSAKDITEKKEAELKILALSKNFQAILDNTDESITLLDLDYKIITLNQVAKRTLLQNTNTASYEGTDFRNYIPDKNSLFYEYYPRALKGESASVQIPYKDYSGDQLWYQTKFNPVYNENNTLIGVSVFAKDITQSKKLELMLKESEERFSKITALAPVGIIITNTCLDIEYANVFAKQIFGYSEEELKRINIVDLVKNFSFTENNMLGVDQFETNNYQFSNERFVGITKTGSELSIVLSSTVIVNNTKNQYIFIIQDISVLNEKEMQIAKQGQKLRDIAWYQSHIVRAPLARIMGLVSLLELEKSDETEKNYIIKLIKESSHELDTAIQQSM